MEIRPIIDATSCEEAKFESGSAISPITKDLTNASQLSSTYVVKDLYTVWSLCRYTVTVSNQPSWLTITEIVDRYYY